MYWALKIGPRPSDFLPWLRMALLGTMSVGIFQSRLLNISIRKNKLLGRYKVISTYRFSYRSFLI